MIYIINFSFKFNNDKSYKHQVIFADYNTMLIHKEKIMQRYNMYKDFEIEDKEINI
jgi:hypothetical protein